MRSYFSLLDNRERPCYTFRMKAPDPVRSQWTHDESQQIVEHLQAQSHDDGECRVWSASADRRKYGFSTFRGRSVGVHRLMWAAMNGPVPKGLYVCHTCDNKSCLRIEHLFVGTNAVNMRDYGKKGLYNRKLTLEEVRAIKAVASVSARNGAAIARQYGITRQAVNLILRKRMWQYV